jgi:hypothetical protein
MSDTLQEPFFRYARAGRIARFLRLDIAKRLAAASYRFLPTFLGLAADRLVSRRKVLLCSRCGGCENSRLTSISMGTNRYRIRMFAIVRNNLLRFGSLHSRS